MATFPGFCKINQLFSKTFKYCFKFYIKCIVHSKKKMLCDWYEIQIRGEYEKIWLINSLRFAKMNTTVHSIWDSACYRGFSHSILHILFEGGLPTTGCEEDVYSPTSCWLVPGGCRQLLGEIDWKWGAAPKSFLQLLLSPPDCWQTLASYWLGGSKQTWNGSATFTLKVSCVSFPFASHFLPPLESSCRLFETIW